MEQIDVAIVGGGRGGPAGLLPQEIRDREWEQISVYATASLGHEQVVAISRDAGSIQFVPPTSEAAWRARRW